MPGPYTNCEPCANACPRQWLFLGLSVRGFSCDIQALGGGGTISVSLFRDPFPVCAGGQAKLYIDEDLQTQEWMDADPGWIGDTEDVMGVPVLFKFEDFEFAGIISRVTKTDNASGLNQIDVEISPPIDLLNGVSVILDDYKGSVDSVPNVINAYGLWEYNPCTGFGGSRNYGKGMPWNKIKDAISALTGVITNTSGIPLGNYLQDNRIKFKPGLPGGFGLLKEDDTGYILDINEIPEAPTYYRFNGQTAKLMDMITQVVEDAGMEFFIELVPAVYSGLVYKFIKIRTIDRTGELVNFSLEDFFQAHNTGCGRIEGTVGEELRLANFNNMLIGPRKQQIYWVENVEGSLGWTLTDLTLWGIKQDGTYGEYVAEDVRLWDLSEDLIQPYWGLDPNGNAIPTWGVGGTPVNISNPSLGFIPYTVDKYFFANMTSLKMQTTFLNPPDQMKIWETELAHAKLGKEVWISYISNNKTESALLIEALGLISSAISNMGLYNVAHFLPFLNKAILNNKQNVALALLKPVHTINIKKFSDSDDFANALAKETDLLYEAILDLAQNYWGKRYQVRIPWLCGKKDVDTGEITFSRSVSDGGWNEEYDIEFNPLLGLNTTSTAMDFFRLPDGRIRPFVRYNKAEGISLRDLDPNEYGYVDFNIDGSDEPDAFLWVKASSMPQFVFENSATLEDPRVVIELKQPINKERLRLWAHPAEIRQNETREVFQNGWFLSSALGANHTGRASYKVKDMDEPLTPKAAAIALQNNDETYGPWMAGSGIGPTDVISDYSLTPWNYGGMTNLALVANEKASYGVSIMYKNQNGLITVPGLPKGRVGEEMMAFNSSRYIAGQRYAGTRAATPVALVNLNPLITYLYADLLTTRFNGDLGPVISSLSISYGTSGITTSYNFQLYTKGYRRFSKARIDRVNEIGQIRQEMFNRFGTS